MGRVVTFSITGGIMQMVSVSPGGGLPPTSGFVASPALPSCDHSLQNLRVPPLAASAKSTLMGRRRSCRPSTDPAGRGTILPCRPSRLRPTECRAHGQEPPIRDNDASGPLRAATSSSAASGVAEVAEGRASPGAEAPVSASDWDAGAPWTEFEDWLVQDTYPRCVAP